MKILFGAQFYTPSIGGVQEVMRQLAEAMVRQGHDVTIATAFDANRDFDVLNGVKIKQFAVTGNLANGLAGDVDAYQEFAVQGEFDLLMVMAAQQWSFDALWPVLDQMPNTRKVFIPCGFSGLYDPLFADYFQDMPGILAKFDHLVFHATEYRDIDFAKQHGLEHFSVIPCGASLAQFDVATDTAFKSRHGLEQDAFVFLNVGSFTGLKGQLEVVRAFDQLQLPPHKRAALILNGNVISAGGSEGGFVGRLFSVLLSRGPFYLLSVIKKRLYSVPRMCAKLAERINRQQPDKKVIITDLEREELTQAFLNADLFVFASNIEYSPLVLFETAAAGTPFLSVDVGNSPEIAEWTQAGIICPSWVDAEGFTRVDVKELSGQMGKVMAQPEQLATLGAAGRKNWEQRLNWPDIALEYEKIFIALVGK